MNKYGWVGKVIVGGAVIASCLALGYAVYTFRKDMVKAQWEEAREARAGLERVAEQAPQ